MTAITSDRPGTRSTMWKHTAVLPCFIIGLAGCDHVDIASVDLEWQGPNGQESVYSLAMTEYDLTNNTFPQSSQTTVAGHSARFRIDPRLTALFCTDPSFGGVCSDPVTGDGIYHEFLSIPNPASIEIYKNERLSSISGMGFSHSWPHLAYTPELSFHTQGIAHSSTDLYVSTKTDIFKVPLGTELQSGSVPHASLGMIPCADGGLDHIGDIDVFDGRLYAPIEKGSNDDGIGARLAVLDLDLDLLYCVDLPQERAGFVAVNPANGLVYLPKSSSELQVYDVNSITHQATPMYVVTLDQPLSDMGDAGAFSERGHFYTATRDNNDDLYIAAYRIQGRKGVRTAKYGPSHIDTFAEGIDVFDAAQVSGINGNFSGQIHIVVIDNVNQKKWTMLHYDVNDPSAL